MDCSSTLSNHPFITEPAYTPLVHGPTVMYMSSCATLPDNLCDLSMTASLFRKRVAQCPSITSDEMLPPASDDSLDGPDIIDLCRRWSKSEHIGPAPHANDFCSGSEKQGYTPRGLWKEWLFRIRTEVKRCMAASSVITVIEPFTLETPDGDTVRFCEPLGPNYHTWTSNTPSATKHLLEAKFPNASIACDGITLMVEAPAPPDWETMITPARIFASEDTGSAPFPNQVVMIVRNDGEVRLAGPAAPLFPPQLCGSSVFRSKHGTSLRVFSWASGPRNDAASLFFGQDILGPMVLVVPA